MIRRGLGVESQPNIREMVDCIEKNLEYGGMKVFGFVS